MVKPDLTKLVPSNPMKKFKTIFLTVFGGLALAAVFVLMLLGDSNVLDSRTPEQIKKAKEARAEIARKNLEAEHANKAAEMLSHVIYIPDGDVWLVCIPQNNNQCPVPVGTASKESVAGIADNRKWYPKSAGK